MSTSQTIQPQLGKSPAPNLKNVRPASTVVGQNIKVWNLKDHPELDKHEVVITRYLPKVGLVERNGQLVETMYLMCEVWLMDADGKAVDDHDQHLILMSGSENFVNRILTYDSARTITSEQPMSGRLRKSGRAWFLD